MCFSEQTLSTYALQWAVTGDTFPVGCKIQNSVVFRNNTFLDNPDEKNPKYKLVFSRQSVDNYFSLSFPTFGTLFLSCFAFHSGNKTNSLPLCSRIEVISPLIEVLFSPSLAQNTGSTNQTVGSTKSWCPGAMTVRRAVTQTGARLAGMLYLNSRSVVFRVSLQSFEVQQLLHPRAGQ